MGGPGSYIPTPLPCPPVPCFGKGQIHCGGIKGITHPGVMEQSRICPCDFGSILILPEQAGRGGREGWWDLEEGRQEVRRTWDGTVGTVPSPQRVDMHKEKVSRREIGSLTVSKKFPSYQKIMSPPSLPCLEPYYRKPLNFSVLDDIGHGIKVSLGLGGCPTGVRGLSRSLISPALH